MLENDFGTYAPCKVSDQPAHLCSLIRIFPGHILDSQRQFLHVDNKDSSQIAQMQRVIGVFLGSTCQKLCFFFTSKKYAYIILTPLNPLLYSETGVYWGIHYFSYFARKHRLWVLIRTAWLRQI